MFLEINGTSVEREKLPLLENNVPEKMQKQSQELLEILAGLLKEEQGPWLWGLTEPTALDAHLVAFIARLQDLGRGQVVPPGLKLYAESAKNGPEWKNVMQGRRTFPQTVD